MEIKSNVNIYEDELLEYYKRPLSYTSKYGLIFLFVFILLLLTFSLLLKYPDTIKTNITISPGFVPVDLYSKKDGNIILISEDNSKVEKGQIIGSFSNYGSLEHILKLQSYLNNIDGFKIKDFDSFLKINLGELQSFYHDFIVKYREYQNITINSQIEKEILNRDSQISLNRELLIIKENAIKVTKENITLNQKDVKRNQILFENGVISDFEFEKIKMKNNSLSQNLLSLQAEIKSIELNIKELYRLKGVIKQDHDDKQNLQSASLINSIDILKSKIIEWLDKNTFTSPVSGKIVYADFLQNYQNIQKDKHLFSIISNDNQAKIGRLFLPINNSGKVKKGNDVLIKLDDFNYQEFGIIYGKIAEISTLPKGNKYLVEVEFPNKLISTYNIDLDKKNTLKGTCEVITEDISLFNRIFKLFNSLTHNPY